MKESNKEIKEEPNKIEIKKAIWVYCRNCGVEYLDSIEWIVENKGVTECPHCQYKLRID